MFLCISRNASPTVASRAMIVMIVNHRSLVKHHSRIMTSKLGHGIRAVSSNCNPSHEDWSNGIDLENKSFSYHRETAPPGGSVLAEILVDDDILHQTLSCRKTRRILIILHGI